MKPHLVLAALFLALAGCATSPADRIAQSQSSFDAWPAEVQTKVRAGQVAVGFTEEQVLVALGEPERTVTRTTDKGNVIVWAYRHRGPQFSFGFGISGGGGHAGYGVGVATSNQPFFSGDAMHVEFKDGKVAAVETTNR
jgi:hypothetical protein